MVQRLRLKRGFTIVELLVTISIFLVISSVLISAYPRFARVQELLRTAQALALSLREAQSFGIAVREFGTGSAIFPAYGIHFDKSTNKEYILFADVDGDGAYDGPGELVKRSQIQTAPFISSLCRGTNTSPPGNCSLSVLDVVFQRPNPTITFVGDSVLLSESDAEINLTLPDGTTKKVIVWISGQVSIE